MQDQVIEMLQTQCSQLIREAEDLRVKQVRERSSPFAMPNPSPCDAMRRRL